MAEAERGGDGERREHVRAVEQADIHLVADIGPGDLAVQVEPQPLGSGEAALGAGDHHRRIGERDEADRQAPHRNDLISKAPPR